MNVINWPHIYLAGPILGCTEGEAKDWREYIDRQLELSYMVGVSPLRCEPIVGERYGFGDNSDPKFGQSRAIAAKNLFDVRRCDATIGYLPKPTGGKHQSYGTLGEIFWAHALGKLVIVVSDDPNVYQHPVVNAAAGWMLPTLSDALDVLHGIFGAYNGGKNV